MNNGRLISIIYFKEIKMKKIIAIWAVVAGMLLAVGNAMAADFGVYGGRNMGSEQNLVGLSVGEKFGKFGVQGTFDRSTTQRVDVNRYTISGSYDVVKLGPVQTNVRVGFAYLDPQSGTASNGGAGFVGAGIAYPVNKKVSLVADYAYQKGNNITKAYDGNILTAGLKYSF
jgi:outer membrane autotransporter protein